MLILGYPSMRFYVYEDRPKRRATIHRAECGFCSGGRGRAGGATALYGAWHPAAGDFATEESARVFARSLRHVRTLRECRRCLRGSDAVAP